VRPATRSSLGAELTALGLRTGDSVLVHAALRRVGPVLGGPDTVIDALLDAVGPRGTLLAYCDWQIDEEALIDPTLRDEVPPFDPSRSRSARDHGAFPEILRTTPGALRSGNPGASCAALGARAGWFTADHPIDYGYGHGSPFGKLVAAGGKVLMLGAPLDTMTLLHHAEQIADFPNKRIKRGTIPILLESRKVWLEYEEFDTSDPPDGQPDDYFATIVGGFVAAGGGTNGRVGQAECLLVGAAPMVAFAVAWMETHIG
jgi:aminoglycoside 3-N-acetyltransferase